MTINTEKKPSSNTWPFNMYNNSKLVNNNQSLDGYRLHFIRGVMRCNPGLTDWILLDTVSHSGQGVASVSANAVGVTVNFDVSEFGTDTQVISSSVTMDETLTAARTVGGASVEINRAIITFTSSAGAAMNPLTAPFASPANVWFEFVVATKIGN